MIDSTLTVSLLPTAVFYLKQGFWLYAWPMLIGFLTILGYQTLGRVVMVGTMKWHVVFCLASIVSMLSLFGWVTMVRSIEMVPLYGCGVGLASAIMSRIYAVTTPVHPRFGVPTIRVIWRGDRERIRQLQESLRARAASGMD